MKNQGRLFIVDPFCVLSYGHNAVAVREYYRRFSEYFSEVVPMLCTESARRDDYPIGTEYPFRYYYDSQMRLRPRVGFIDNLTRRDIPKVSKCVRSLLGACGIPIIVDRERVRAIHDWRNIFRDFQLGSNDVLFFPSGDYYSVRGLMRFLPELAPDQCPVVYLNLINVMENGCKDRVDASLEMCREILEWGRVGKRFFVSAETPMYASFLSSVLMTEVDYIPFPPIGKRSEIKEKATFQVSVIGAARGDKGYFRLYDIITKVNKIVGDVDVVFSAQGMAEDNWEYSAEYEAKLKELKNLDLKPPSLTDSEIVSEYENSDVLLMPYCPRTYRLRGSAVMSEAMAYSRVLVTAEDCAFSEVVSLCEMGATCTTDEEYAEAIHVFFTLDPKRLMEKSDQARKNFEALYREKFNAVMSRIMGALN